MCVCVCVCVYVNIHINTFTIHKYNTRRRFIPAHKCTILIMTLATLAHNPLNAVGDNPCVTLGWGCIITC